MTHLSAVFRTLGIRWRRLGAFVPVALTINACHVWAPSRQPVPQTVAAHPRSTIRITRSDRSVHEIEKPVIAGDSLVGTPADMRTPARIAIPLADIQSVEVRRISGTRTVLLVGGIGVTAAVIIAANRGDDKKPAPPDTSRTPWSCPLVYTWDGSNWRLDSGTFGGAIMRALQRADLDNLDYATPIDGELRLTVANELEETDHVDALHVLAVDHDRAFTVAPDPAGVIHTIGAVTQPVRAFDFTGRDALARVRSTDGTNWESTLEGRDPARLADIHDGLELAFIRPAAARHAHVVLDGQNTLWSAYLLGEFLQAHGRLTQTWYDSLNTRPREAAAMGARLAAEAFLSVSVWAGGGWVRQGTFWEAGPEVVKRQVLDLDLTRVSGDTVRLRLESAPSFWLIDRVALDYTTDQAVTVTNLELTDARDRHGVDVRALIAAVDDRYYVMERGDRAELRYRVPDVPAGRARSYLLRSTGWYRVHTAMSGDADTEVLRRVNDEPFGISRLAVERMNDALRSMRRAAQ